MGNPFKKAFKAITKPISKVLDKIVPNEIKPFLPYAAAFAPYMLPAGIGSGIMGGMNPMLRRALITGSLNLGSQLSQEGSEGEFSGLSALLAAGQGALTAPKAAESLTGMTTQGTLANQGIIGSEARMELANRGLLTKAKDAGLAGLSKGAEFLEKGVDILGPGGTEPGLNMETLQAAALPISQGSGDLAFADAQLALRDYENEMANQDQLDLIDNAGRRTAIRAAMEAAGHLEEVIVDTLAELGLKQGGIVGLKKGGRIKYDRGGVASVLPKGREADYRGGGVIPVGSRERADDVPARLSKNEFVMTADAVRAAGGGSINKGAKRMYKLMHNLEARV